MLYYFVRKKFHCAKLGSVCVCVCVRRLRLLWRDGGVHFPAHFRLLAPWSQRAAFSVLAGKRGSGGQRKYLEPATWKGGGGGESTVVVGSGSQCFFAALHFICRGHKNGVTSQPFSYSLSRAI